MPPPSIIMEATPARAAECINSVSEMLPLSGSAGSIQNWTPRCDGQPCASRSVCSSVATATGPISSVENNFAAGGVRPRLSATIRSGWGCGGGSVRAVSSGSSTSTVSDPTITAACAARRRCTWARAASPVIHLLSPGLRRDAAIERGGQLECDCRSVKRPFRRSRRAHSSTFASPSAS